MISYHQLTWNDPWTYSPSWRISRRLCLEIAAKYMESQLETRKTAHPEEEATMQHPCKTLSGPQTIRRCSPTILRDTSQPTCLETTIPSKYYQLLTKRWTSSLQSLIARSPAGSSLRSATCKTSWLTALYQSNSSNRTRRSCRNSSSSRPGDLGVNSSEATKLWLDQEAVAWSQNHLPHKIRTVSAIWEVITGYKCNRPKRFSLRQMAVCRLPCQWWTTWWWGTHRI